MNSPISITCGKVRHPSRKLAMESLHIVTRALDANARDRCLLHAFLCKQCGGFHLGNSVPRMKSNRREKRPRNFRMERVDDPDAMRCDRC